MPQPEPVQIARGDGEVVRDGLHVGGQLFVFQHGSSKTFARLDVVKQIFQYFGRRFNVFHRGGDVRAVGGQHAFGGTGQAQQLLRKENDIAHREVDLRAVGGNERVDVVHRAHRLLGNCAQVVQGRGKIGERLFVQHDAPQIRDRVIELFGGIFDALDEPGSRARDFLQIKRLLAVDLVAVHQHRRRVGSGDDGDILVAEKAGLFDDETRVVVNFAALVNVQENRHAFAVLGELDAGNAAHLHAGEQNPRALLEAADIAGVQAQFVGAAEQAGALAELNQQHRQQRQPDEHKQADFGFQSRFFHD